jgi:hypothetical protein
MRKEQSLTDTAQNSPDRKRPNLTLLGERMSPPIAAPPSSPAGANQTATTPQTTAAAARSTPSRAGYHEQILAVLSAISMVLAARMMAMLATLGAFVLAMTAMTNPTPLTIVIAAAYYVGVLLPLVWLAARKG